MCLWVFFLLDVFSLFFFFKQKTAYEVRISDWSSDVCSSDLSNAWHRSSACKGVGESPGGRDDGGLGFEKGVEPFEAVLAAPAARLDAAIGRRPADVAIGVDPNHAGFDPRRHAVRPPGSDDRRVGKGCVSTCRFRWRP